jgi:hypothetical protein
MPKIDGKAVFPGHLTLTERDVRSKVPHHVNDTLDADAYEEEAHE